MRIAAALVLTAATLHPARAQERPPALSAAAIVGRYDYRDRELTGFIELRADHSFEYRVDAVGPPVEGEGPFHLLARGVWRMADPGGIVLANAPTAPPVFRMTSAVRDPTVRAAFTIVSDDQEAVQALGLLTDDGENGELNMLTSGSWTIPLTQAWDTDVGRKGTPTRLPRNWEIVRSSDDRSLLKMTLSPDGPNRFVFNYTPSPIEPFELAARPVEDEPGAIEVEFGTASITMHRTTPR